MAAWFATSRLTRFLRTAGAEARIRRAQQSAARHPLVIDGLFALALLTFGTPHLVTDRLHHGVAGWAIQLGMLGPLVFRRRAPFTVFTIIAGMAFLEYLTSVALPVADLGLLVALYTVAARSALGRLLAACAAMEFGAVLVAHSWGFPSTEPRIFLLLSGTTVAAAGLGLNTRTRRAYLNSLEERARRLEFERDQQAQIAAVSERASIAREVHDIVTHSLSVMVALTDGASFAVHSAPDRAADAIGKASEVGRQAIADMQRVLGVLRRDGSGPSLHPQPGMSQLDTLLSEVRAAGLPVELVVSGTAPTVTSGVELAVYRVVQEGLTNTRKHTEPGASARVELRFHDDAIDVTVVDNGTRKRPSAGTGGANGTGGDHGLGGGHGIAGMRERVAVYGGVLEAGRAPGQAGWRVHARIPLEDPVPEPSALEPSALEPSP
jgi:signal transduction histidine kinase